MKRLVALVAGLALAACSSTESNSNPLGNSTTVKDTLGNRFTLTCGSYLCTATPSDPNITAKSCEVGSGTDYFVLVLSNILTIMSLPITSSGEYQLAPANPAKPVACATNADCLAPMLAVDVDAAPLSWVCDAGICRLPGQPLLTSDVITLCQADIPWPTSCPYATNPKFAPRLAEVSTVCGSNFTCEKIPALCALGNTPTDAGIPSPDAPIVDAPVVDAGLSD